MMLIVNKIILVFTLFLINTLSAYGENFELICEFNKSALLICLLYTSTHTPMSHAGGMKTLKVLHISVLIKGVLLAPRMYHLPYTSNG